MSKITDYLRQRLAGEVRDDAAAQAYFSEDGGIFAATTLLAVYPRTTNDVRKAVRFSWRLAERGTTLPLVARGFGRNQVSSAVGGTAVIMPSHMSRVLEFDPKLKLVRVQPGLTLAALNEAVATYGLKFFANDDDDFATVGGLLGANTVSRKFAKYGSVNDWVDRVEVVLSNGEVIQTGRLSKRELSVKKGLQTMEGEIYRSLDALIDENSDRLNNLGDNLPFAINKVKLPDGSFDLTPLFIGSEGTLGIITQVILRVEHMTNGMVFVAAALHGQNLSELAEKVTALEPSELSFVDGETLGLLEQKVGDTSWKKFSDNLPSAMIFVEFDDKKSSKKAKKMARILEDFGIEDVKMASEFEDQESLRSMRDSVRAVANFNERGVVAPSIGMDLLVQPSRIPEFVEKIRAIFAKHHLDGGIWGDLASGRITAQPLLNPVNLGQKQSLIKLIPDLRAAANDYSAPATNQIANGRLGSLFISDLYDKDALKIFADVKTTFDPFGILNPGVKFGLDNEELLRSIKRDFTHDRFLEF